MLSGRGGLSYAWEAWASDTGIVLPATHRSVHQRSQKNPCHGDVIKWKHFPRYWPFVRGIHRPPVNSPHKGQWRGALMFSLICVWINGWVNNGEAGYLRRYRTHCDVTVMLNPTRMYGSNSIVITAAMKILSGALLLPEINLDYGSQVITTMVYCGI